MVLTESAPSHTSLTYSAVVCRSLPHEASTSSTSSYFPKATNAATRRTIRQLLREFSSEDLAEWDTCNVELTPTQKSFAVDFAKEDKEKEDDREWQVVERQLHETHTHTLLLSPTHSPSPQDVDYPCDLINTNPNRTWDHHEEPLDFEDDMSGEDEDGHHQSEYLIGFDYDGTALYSTPALEQELSFSEFPVQSRRLYYQEVFRRCLTRDWGVPKSLAHRVRKHSVNHRGKLFFQANKHKIYHAFKTTKCSVGNSSKTCENLGDYPFLDPFGECVKPNTTRKQGAAQGRQGANTKQEERKRIARLHKKHLPYGRPLEERSQQQLARFVRAQKFKQKIKLARALVQKRNMISRRNARESKRRADRNFTALPPRKAGQARPFAQYQAVSQTGAPIPAPAPARQVFNIQPGQAQKVVADNVILHQSKTFEEFRYNFYQRYQHKLESFSTGQYICTGVRNAPLGPYVKDRFMHEMRKRRVEPILSFHGSRMSNMQSICDRGLLVPGQAGATDIKVAHGSAFGTGIYTCMNIGYPMGYTNSRTLFVCAVIADLSKPHITGWFPSLASGGQTTAEWPSRVEQDVTVCGDVVVLFKHQLVVPLFLLDFWRTHWQGVPEEYREYDAQRRQMNEDQDEQVVDESMHNEPSKAYADQTAELPHVFRPCLVKLLKKAETHKKMVGVQLSHRVPDDKTIHQDD